MTLECVVDTTVLQKANAPLQNQPKQRRLIQVRLKLLERIRNGKVRVLISSKLLDEYRRQIREPRNDYVKAFFAVLASTDRCERNWAEWTGGSRAKARKCRFPEEDDHVLRTATRPKEKAKSTTIVTEEERMLKADACIYREFRVHVQEPARFVNRSAAKS